MEDHMKSPAALVAYMDHHDLTREAVAAALEVTGPAVSQRRSGRCRTTIGDVLRLREVAAGEAWDRLCAAAILDVLEVDAPGVEVSDLVAVLRVV